MSNTTKRIISAIVLMSIVLLCLLKGKVWTLAFILVAGIICVDEIFVNFFKKKRESLEYLASQGAFIAPFVYFNFIDYVPHLVHVFVNAGVLLCLILVIYLFYIKMESKILLRICNKYSFLAGIFILLPLLSLTSLLHYSKWISLIFALLFINFGMDTGAWFFGKNFGKNKLWPSVSPNKTIEGLIGGILTSGVLGGVFWHISFGEMTPALFGLFCLLGLLSQIGDLIQSKIKRQYNIKDSSNLIPGHGGVFDRIDSLLFLVPFYATSLRYIYVI